MRVLYGTEFTFNPQVSVGYYFFIEKTVYEYFKFKNGKELYYERKPRIADFPKKKEKDEAIKTYISRGWEEVFDFRQFLTHPIPEVRVAVKRSRV